MMNNFAVILIIVQTWISLHLYVVNASNPLRGYHGAPIVEPFDSVVIDVKGNSIITCKAKKPITWISELLNEDHANAVVKHVLFDNNIENDDSILFTDEQNIYRSILEFESITVEYVGRYYCVFNESIKEDDLNYDLEVANFKASSIYVFVNDSDNLLYEHDHHMIVGSQYEPFVIPCKPTSPNVKVELLRDDGEVKRYNPENGFLLCCNDVFSKNMTCQASIEGKLQRIEILVVVYASKRSSGEKPLSAYLKKPYLISDSNNFARNGANFSLTCHVEMTTDMPYSVAFTLPNGVVANKDMPFLILSDLEHEHSNKRKSHVNLTIIDSVDSRDQGDYKCTLMDYHNNTNSATESIKFVDGSIVELNLTNPVIVTTQGKKTARFLIDYFAFPSAKFTWYNPKNEEIIKDLDIMKRAKYDIEMRKDQIKFTVKKPGIEDFGNYTIEATSGGEIFTKQIRLVVSDKPTCEINDVYVQLGEEVSMTCSCLAYPAADITWSYRPCNDLQFWPECRRPNERSQNEFENDNKPTENQQNSEISQASEIRFSPSQPGTVRCKAKNDLGVDNVSGHIKILDYAEPFIINGITDEQMIADGDSIELECSAAIYDFTNTIKWFKDGVELDNGEEFTINDSNGTFSYRRTIVFNPISKKDEGEYVCEVFSNNNHENESSQQRISTIIVHDSRPPLITSNFNQSRISRPLGEGIILECLISGLPVPVLKWYKNGEIFEIEENDARVSLTNHNMTLGFSVLKPIDSGTFECVAENRIGTERITVELEIRTPTKQLNQAVIIGVISIILLLVLLSLYLCCKVRRKKRLIAELKAAGLANFEEGNVENIDPDMNLDEQADLLPYDKKYEFPREKLKLGKQLGAGAFGVVVKAIAQGIVQYEEESAVAVKMVKKQTDNEVTKALVSELKIMIHLGQNLNVVNLLGAVTKNIAKRELMVIVEYCRFGNIQSFLVKHRPYFIDQVRNDKIDPMIMKNEMRWSKNSAFNSYNSDGNPYTQQPAPMGVVGNPSAHMTTQGYVRHSGFQQVDSCNTEATVLSNMEHGEDSAMLSNNSGQPLWRSNYATDYKGPARTVCTSDLVCWAFQVSRGMEYLTSRKVLHGDLAARNILLCEDNIVKICDFGLARSLYKNDNYKKKGEAPLPFKWLSLEAISDHVFSTYSDIWAFGIVLWEFFTLGKVPYPGMEANQDLFYKLRDGYRMEKPNYATQDLYDIMLNCWNAKPESRPTFNELGRRLSAFMMDSVKDHYLDLNEPYLQANMKNYQRNIPDYLTSLSIPEEEAPTPPLALEESFYVNNSTGDINGTSADYLSMSPKSGTVKYNNSNIPQKSNSYRPDSPTIVKNLDTSPKNKKNVNKKPELPEEVPMLARNQNHLPSLGDSDEEPQNGYTEMSFSNPNHQSSPTEDPEYKNVFSSDDNYVNVPATNKKSSVANPSYITFNTVNERLS